jgi:hypothetical protein
MQNFLNSNFSSAVSQNAEFVKKKKKKDSEVKEKQIV